MSVHTKIPKISMKKAEKSPVTGYYKKAAIIAISALILFVLAAIIMAEPPSAPGSIAKNQTFDSYENIFYRYEINRFPSNAEVSNTSNGNLSVGVATEQWNLNFGIVPTAGSFGKRHISLKNTKEESVHIQLMAYGDIKPFVEFSNNDFNIERGSVPIDIIFRTKQDTPTGNYSGEIDVVVRQPKYGVLRALE